MLKFFLLLVLTTSNGLFAQDQGVEEMVIDVEDDVIVGESGISYHQQEEVLISPAPAPVATATTTQMPTAEPIQSPAAVPTPAVVPTPQTTLPAQSSSKKGDVYEYAYYPKESEDESYNYSKAEGNVKAGQPGDFIFSIYGELLNYKSGSSSKGGGGVELGVQFNLFKYMSLALTSSIGAREGNEHKNNLYPLGLRLAPRFRILPWLFMYVDAGAEIAKVAKGDWEHPFWVFGGGLMFNMGSMDKKAEYNFNKASSVRRTLLIVGLEKIASPNVTTATPDAIALRMGLSLEF